MRHFRPVMAALVGLLVLCQLAVSAWPGEPRPSTQDARTSLFPVEWRMRDLGGRREGAVQREVPPERHEMPDWTQAYALGAAAVIVALAFLSGNLMLEHRRRQQAEM